MYIKLRLVQADQVTGVFASLLPGAAKLDEPGRAHIRRVSSASSSTSWLVRLLHLRPGVRCSRQQYFGGLGDTLLNQVLACDLESIRIPQSFQPPSIFELVYAKLHILSLCNISTVYQANHQSQGF